jgi:hypothetical protein
MSCTVLPIAKNTIGVEPRKHGAIPNGCRPRRALADAA